MSIPTLITRQSLKRATHTPHLPTIPTYHLACAANEASGTNIDTTLVDYAELVWRLEKDYTQKQIGEALGWSRTDVANYAALEAIAEDVWSIIVTTFASGSVPTGSDTVTEDVTGVTNDNGFPISPFTENLLRNILDLGPAQQLDLCTPVDA
jgi:hypothetical protein